MRSWRPFCWGWRGLMRSMAMPSLSHQRDASASLANLGPRVLHDGAPVRDLRLDVRAEFTERPTGGLRRYPRERLAHARLRQGFVDRFVEASDDGDGLTVADRGLVEDR